MGYLLYKGSATFNIMRKREMKWKRVKKNTKKYDKEDSKTDDRPMIKLKFKRKDGRLNPLM